MTRMQTFFFFSALFSVLILSTTGQWQWTSQQLATYYQQQYNNWYWQQQRLAQQPIPTAVPTVPGVQNHPVFGRVESDDKGNMWVGDDTFKLQIISRYSPPSI